MLTHVLKKKIVFFLKQARTEREGADAFNEEE
jgi:hypothetical protein